MAALAGDAENLNGVVDMRFVYRDLLFIDSGALSGLLTGMRLSGFARMGECFHGIVHRKHVVAGSPAMRLTVDVWEVSSLSLFGYFTWFKRDSFPRR